MRRLYRKLAFNYSEGGPGRLLHKAFRAFLNALYSETRWNIYSRTGLATPEPCEPLTECRKLSYQDLLDANYSKLAAFPEEIRLRFDGQNICYGFYLSGKLAVVGWLSEDSLELDHRVVFPCPSGIALFDFITLPEFRGRGLYTNALDQLVRIYGISTRSIYIAVDPNNFPSSRGIERAGFTRLLCVSRRRILGLIFISRDPAP